MKSLWKRYWSPSKMWARKLGDSALLAGAAITAYLPSVEFSNPKWNDYKYIAVIVLTIFVKIATNFTLKENK